MKPTYLLAALALAACGEPEDQPTDSGVPTDIGVDAGVFDSGSFPYDASVPDTGSRQDAQVIDGSLAGTSLEGITLEWSGDLLLCEHWLENGTLAEAEAQKVEVHLSEQVRTTLDPAALAGATVSEGRVARSPFAADQWSFAGGSSQVTAWQLTGPPESASLFAEIEHDLGAAGALIETIAPRRSTGDRSPVRYVGPTAEAHFSYRPPNADPFALVPCDEPSTNLETAVVVLVAFDADDWITVLREQRTQVNLEGSSDVYPTRAEALISGPGPYNSAVGASGHWSQVYTAGHHNGNEFSLVRFDHDLLWNYSVFGPLARSEPPSYPASMPKTVELDGVNFPGSPGSVTVTSVALPAATSSTKSYDVEVDWTRIDETQLARELVGCASPEIKTLWGGAEAGEYLFQLGFCQTGDPIGDLALFVPVYFQPEPHLAGTRFTSGMISTTTVESHPGVEIDLGSHRVQIGDSGVLYRVVILDQSGTELARDYGYGVELFTTGPIQSEVQNLRASSTDGTVTATVARVLIGQGVGNSGIYAPVSFELTFAGERHQVVAWDALDYTNTHHNWDDLLVSEDDALRMTWHVLGFGQQYEVSATRLSDGVEILPLTPLEVMR